MVGHTYGSSEMGLLISSARHAYLLAKIDTVHAEKSGSANLLETRQKELTVRHKYPEE